MAGHRIVEVVGSLDLGGAERVALEIAAGLAARGWQAEVLVAGAAPKALPYTRSMLEEAESRGVRVSHVLFSGARDAGSRRRLREFVRDARVELAHTHNRPQDWQVTALCRGMGLPALYSVHLPDSFARARQRALYAASGRLASSVVCVSEAVAARVELVPKQRLRVIHNGIRLAALRPPSPEARAEARRALGFGDGDFGWLCAARLHPQKGHAHLLEALARLPSGSRAKLALAGDGPLERELVARCARLGLGARVTFLGARRDVPALLGAADGYACASLAEGHPLSLLEAMATALPIVAPRLAAITEIAVDGAPRFYGPPLEGRAEAHDPAQLAAAMLAVERDPGAARARAAAARERVTRRYSLDAMIDAHEALYRELLDRPSRPSVGAWVGRLLGYS